MTGWGIGAAVLLILVILAFRFVDKPHPANLAFQDIRVFDGTRFIEMQTVLVINGKVSVSKRQVPAGVTKIDGSGKTLLPGFIDAHVHVELYDPKRVLRGGITTARDLAWPPERIFPLAKRLGEQSTEGPYLLVAGPMITARGGYPTKAGWAPKGTGLEVRNESEAVWAVTELSSKGADVIKVAQEPHAGPVLDHVLLTTVVNEAHGRGLKVTSHLGSLDQLEVALDAGVDELAHGLWSAERIPEALIDRMVAEGLVVIPTLHIDPSPVRVDNLRRFLVAGGTAIYGTDMGNAGPPPGIDVTELRLMIDAGMSLEGVLASATSAAADHLGLADRGSIAAGKRADLIVVKGDPRKDLNTLESPLLVMRDGKEAS